VPDHETALSLFAAFAASGTMQGAVFTVTNTPIPVWGSFRQAIASGPRK
jgi:hypothetical protein